MKIEVTGFNPFYWYANFFGKVFEVQEENSKCFMVKNHYDGTGMRVIKREDARIVEGYREGMPPVPERMQMLPVRRGYPVPFFVEMVNGDYDFRVASAEHKDRCVVEKLCWVCGNPMERELFAFVAGCMCALNSISGEPPSHYECAKFSVEACPFVNQTQVKRNEANMPKDAQVMPGHIARQPKVSLIWVTDAYKLIPNPPSYLLQMNVPQILEFYAHGRPARREEVEEAIKTGIPLLAKSGAPVTASPGEIWKAEKMLEDAGRKLVDKYFPIIDVNYGKDGVPGRKV